MPASEGDAQEAGGWAPPVDTSSEPEVVEGDVLQEIEVPQVIDAEDDAGAPEKPSRRRPRAAKTARPTGEGRAPRKSPDAPASRKTVDGAPKTRKPAAPRPRSARSRPRTDVPQG